MKKISIGLALGLLIFNAFVVNVWAQETIDFEGLATNSIVNQVFGSGGSGPISVFGVNPNRPGINAAVIFDSANPTGGDSDLGTPNQQCPGGGPGNGTDPAVGPGGEFENCTPLGKVLIIQNAGCLDGSQTDCPDDLDFTAIDGATITLDFSDLIPVTLEEMTFLDIDGNGPNPRVELFDELDNLLGSFPIPNNMPQNGSAVVSLGPTSNVVKMIVHLNGSGAIDDIVFIPPEPPKCSIGDYVWEDANRDGCQDPDERPIEGVKVTLFENCNNPTPVGDPDFTDDAGFYEFTGLDCGKEYRVQFGDAGDIYAYTEADSCTDGDPNIPPDAKDSDCSQNDGFSGCVTFPDPVNAPDNPTIDCGYVCEGKIGDYVWLDTNDNTGCQDDGEYDQAHHPNFRLLFYPKPDQPDTRLGKVTLERGAADD